MGKFLFRFGYSTPEQLQANRDHGWDDEWSGAFFVFAADRAQALTWGQTVANSYVRNLFEAAGQSQAWSWADSEFAFWLDDNPEDEFTAEELSSLPEVKFGQLPDFSAWKC